MLTVSEKVLEMLKAGSRPKEIIKELGCSSSLPYVVASRNRIKVCRNKVRAIQRWAKTHSMESTIKKFNCTKDQYWSYMSKGKK